MSRKTTEEIVAAEQRAEGEPTRRSRVEGMVKERWPRNPHTNTWVTHHRDPSGAWVYRHVSVRFGDTWFEGIASTWLDAMDQVTAKRKA